MIHIKICINMETHKNHLFSICSTLKKTLIFHLSHLKTINFPFVPNEKLSLFTLFRVYIMVIKECLVSNGMFLEKSALESVRILTSSPETFAGRGETCSELHEYDH